MPVNFLKVIREKQNITQSDLANKTNISLRQIRNIENHNSKTSVYTALKLAKALNCKVEDVFSL